MTSTSTQPNGLQSRFVEVMAEVCAPVTVLTTWADGRPHGTTVSAFASLSLQPPMVVTALDRRSDLLAVLERTGQVGVNVLASTQHELARRFAQKGPDKFDGVEWTDDHGVPRLPGVVGWLACRVARFTEGGDHVLVIGAVEEASAVPGAPLAYHRRLFGTHLPAGAPEPGS